VTLERVQRHPERDRRLLTTKRNTRDITRRCTQGNLSRAFRYDDLGLTLLLLDTIKQQAIETREGDPTAVGFRRRRAA
jgi:hypothetical protein